MALTEQEKARLRARWRALAMLAGSRDVANSEEFRRLALEAPNWLSPLDHQADAYVLFGFARLAKALAVSRVNDAARRTPMTQLAAAEVLTTLDAVAPDPDPAPHVQRLPYVDD